MINKILNLNLIFENFKRHFDFTTQALWNFSLLCKMITLNYKFCTWEFNKMGVSVLVWFSSCSRYLNFKVISIKKGQF